MRRPPGIFPLSLGQALVFLRDVGFIGADAEGGKWSVWVAAVVAQRDSEVDRPSSAERADDEVAQAGHDLRCGPGADLDAPARPAGPAGARWPSPGRPGPGRCAVTERPASRRGSG
jgi:hypothetical protein